MFSYQAVEDAFGRVVAYASVEDGYHIVIVDRNRLRLTTAADSLRQDTLSFLTDGARDPRIFGAMILATMIKSALIIPVAE